MKRLLLCSLIAALTVSTPLFAKKVFKQGTLVNVTKEDLGGKKSDMASLFIVRIDDIVYSGRGGKVNKKTGDMGQGLIVGDPVQAAVDGENLYLKKQGGKEIKTKIVKRERADAAPAPPPPTR
jgi:hypothetical protein